MALTTDSLTKIAAAGGGLIIDCKGYTVDSLVKIAVATKGKGGKLILTNTTGYTVDSLVKIGTAGAGNVIIDTRKQ